MLDSELVARLAIPGLPEWSGLVILLLGLLFLAAFLMMPFSVFGLKSRLDAIEAQLDDVQQEIRSLALRLPEPGLRRRAPALDETYDELPDPVRPEPPARDDRAPRMTPPIPPPPTWPDDARGPGRRTEPRLGGPRR